MAPQKVAIVTGASSGMGTALAKHFASKNWLVALFDINDTAGQKLAESLGHNTAYFHADVANYDSQAAAFMAVWKQWGRIDALVANAGIVDKDSIYMLRNRGRAIDDFPPALNTACTDVDWKGFLWGVQLSIHFMRHNSPRAGGTIVGTASVAGVIPHEAYPEYNGAKAAVINFVRGAAEVLWRKDRIALNCICPGIVATRIIPPEMVAAVSSEFLTPVETIVRAYASFLDELEDDSYWEKRRHGVAVEASTDKVLVMRTPELENGKASLRAVTVWDPLFKQIHGETCELPSAIP